MEDGLSNEYVTKKISISEIKTLLDDGYEVQVDSPDGWVNVNFFVDKGMWEEYIVSTESSTVRCNSEHLFKDSLGGWVSAKHLWQQQQFSNVVPHLMTRKGPKKVVVSRNEGVMIPIVDINVDHENHRYFTEDFESHNTGVGKSLAMCHMAAYNLLCNRNVLYITLEMAEERIAQRIDANLLDVTISELIALSKVDYLKKVDRLKQTTKGKLIIKEYPTASAGSAHFRHLLNELRIKKNFVPDIIYIDYLNLCVSARIKNGSQANTYTYIKAIAEELRGLAVEFNLPIVTATQANRSALNSSDVGLENTSDSIGLPMTVDFMIAMISTEELEQLGQIMIKQLKNRYGDPSLYKRFVVGVDKSKMRLYDVDYSQQEGIDEGPVMDSGHFMEEETERGKKVFDRSKFRGFN